MTLARRLALPLVSLAPEAAGEHFGWFTAFAGRDFVRVSAMQKVKQPFEVVVTTNSGYPLDLNLYQSVKGMSAGARILSPGGLLILACECREGVPAGSPLDRLLRSAGSPEEILTLLSTPGFTSSLILAFTSTFPRADDTQTILPS